MKKLSILLAFTVIFLGGVLGNMPLEASADENSYIEVTTTTEGGDTVKGNAMVSAVPASGKAVEKVTFYAKAVNEPDENYYPYAPDSEAPYTWSWSTGAPWVPDGEYVLKMVIDYTSGETETITRNIFTKNDREPNSPDSPSALNASARTNNSVTLTWEPSASQKKFDYVIYQDGTKIGTTAENTFTIEQLSPGSTYSFRVKTRDIYNNVSIDDNSINVLIPSESSDPLPDLSSIQAEGPAGATPGGSGYSGNVNLSVSATDNDQIAKVEFFVKTYSADESAYWKFPAVQKNGDNYSVNWQTTSAPDGNVIIKAAAYDSAGQARTITKVLLVDNEDDGGPEEPAWEPAETPPANRIIGYLAGWSTYNGFEIMNDLDASRLTHINYAFALIGTDLKVKMSDPEQDPKNFAELSKLKAKYPHLKSVIAIGGWGGSANFIEAASTEESREIFADSAVEFMLENGFDGVDLDWEYPVTGGGPGTYPNPDDRENYPLLLKELREKLDEQGEKDDKHYILSIAGGATAGFANNTQLGLSQQYLDYVQIMTYDIHGTWEQKADFNAPLLDDNGKTYSVDKGVQAYLDAGVPPEKLVMGVPFYGYKYNVTSGENNGLRQPFEGSGSITYDRVMKDGLLENGYNRFWDEGSKVPYLYNAEESIFISYDDKESMELKAEYIRDNELGGAMIWEISQDFGNDLLASLYNVLKDPIEDKSPPVTVSEASGEKWTDHSFLGSVTITLSAADHHSGVEKTEYRLNDGQWETYSEPVVIEADGKTTISYRSIDKEGNTEEISSLEVHVTAITFNNLYGLIQYADMHHGQKTALKAKIQQAERAKTDDSRQQKLQNAIIFVKRISDKQIDSTSRQDLKIFLEKMINNY